MRNAKASMAFASTSAAPTSDSEEWDNTEEDTEKDTDEEAAEEAEWIDSPFFPVEHVLEEYISLKPGSP